MYSAFFFSFHTTNMSYIEARQAVQVVRLTLIQVQVHLLIKVHLVSRNSYIINNRMLFIPHLNRDAVYLFFFKNKEAHVVN